MPLYYDAKTTSSSRDIGIGIEPAAGAPSSSMGVTVNPISTDSYTGRWTGDFVSQRTFFNPSNELPKDFEYGSFQFENSLVEEDWQSNILGSAKRVEIESTQLSLQCNPCTAIIWLDNAKE